MSKTKKRKQVYKLWQIDWKDAKADGGWNQVDKYKTKLLIVHSVGWKLAETKESVLLAQQMSESGQAADTINIPKSCIVKQYKLPRKYEIEYRFE